MARLYRLASGICILVVVGCGLAQAQPTPTPVGSEALTATAYAYLPLVLKTYTPTPTVTFPYTGVISFCGIPNFAWTIGNALARSAQPSGTAWQCLKQKGFTTIVRQNIEDDDGSEKSAVESLGMQYLGADEISDDTAYHPDMLQAMMEDVILRLKRGERILVHDSGGRGRMGLWETTFLLWDGWTSKDALDRYVAFGWKLNGGPGYECPGSGIDPTDLNGSNGQYQAIQIIAQALGQPSYDPSPDTYGNVWANCPWPDYMSGWNYNTMQWPVGKGGRWSLTGIIVP